jgi:probable HAF family extracellular repeat protein
MTNLGTLAGVGSSVGNGINDTGQVVGASLNAAFRSHAFLYSGSPGAGGTMVDLGGVLPGGDVNQSGSEAFAINNAGQITGEARAADGRQHAFLYSGTPGAGGAMVDIGPTGVDSTGLAINEAGSIVGLVWVGPVTSHACRYTGTPGTGGALLDLGSGAADDINEAGLAVGQTINAGSSRAALWQNDAAATVVNLDEWLDATNPTLGSSWTLLRAFGINDHGIVTGGGIYNDGPGGLSDGTRAFILDASSLVPEPTGVSLLASGAASFVLRRKRSRHNS